MWNFIKYLPLEWRDRPVDCTPRGPNFAWAPRIKIPVADSVIRLRVPRHSPAGRNMAQHSLLPGSDLLDQGLGRYAVDVMANDHWGFRTALLRHWAFWGPWMTGLKSHLTMSISVIGRQPDSEFADISYFNPRAFEMVLMHYFNDSYGHRAWDDGKPRRYGPVDWQVHHQLPIFSASCKVYQLAMDGITPFTPDHLFVFPITENHFVQIRFRQGLYDRDEHGKLTFDATPIQALQDAILNSLTLELSPTAQAAWDKAQAECGGQGLTDNFAPLRWPTSTNPPSDTPVQPWLGQASNQSI